MSTPRDAAVEEPEQRILPDGCIELIFHLGARFQELSAHDALSAYFTAPQRLAALFDARR